MERRFFIFLLFAAFLLFQTGCRTPKVNISMQVPGEINPKGISKIAVMDFNTIETNEKLGIYNADQKTLKLAKKLILSAFYKDPFYSVVDVNVETLIKKRNFYSQLKNRFDAILYGRVWWIKTPEFHATYPKVFTLTKKHTEWVKTKYINYPMPVIDETQDKLIMIPYRAQKAVLIVSFSLYKIHNNGRLEKLFETLYPAKAAFLIDNGKYSESENQINKELVISRVELLKQSEGPESNEETISNNNDSSVKVEKAMFTIPPALYPKVKLLAEAAKKFGKQISPHKEIFSIPIDVKNKKIKMLLKEGAFSFTEKYIVEDVLAQNDKAAIPFFYDLDFDSGAEVVFRNMKHESPPSKEDVKNWAKDYIDSNLNNIYCYAIAEEAKGNFEKALFIYKYIFYKKPLQEYADGLARCLTALDMADKVSEKKLNKEEAAEKQSLR